MTSDEILAKLQPTFQEIFDDDSLVILRSTTAADIEDWDSLAHINLVVAIEKSFHVKFALGELQALKNVGDIVELIGKKLS